MAKRNYHHIVRRVGWSSFARLIVSEADYSVRDTRSVHPLQLLDVISCLMLE